MVCWTETTLDTEQGFLFALGLSVRVRVCFPVVGIEALRCISELQCEVDIIGVLPLGAPFSFVAACTLPELTEAEPCPLWVCWGADMVGPTPPLICRLIMGLLWQTWAPSVHISGCGLDHTPVPLAYLCAANPSPRLRSAKGQLLYGSTQIR